MSNPRIEVVRIKGGEVVDTVPLRSTDERYVERVLSGLLRNMDTNTFFAREVLDEPENADT